MSDAARRALSWACLIFGALVFLSAVGLLHNAAVDPATLWQRRCDGAVGSEWRRCVRGVQSRSLVGNHWRELGAGIALLAAGFGLWRPDPPGARRARRERGASGPPAGPRPVNRRG